MTPYLKTEVDLYDELIVYSNTGSILYRGKPDGYPVKKAAALENEQIVVLLKFWAKKPGDFENLLLLKSDGGTLWRAQLPNASSGDAYVDFDVIEGKLFANSWSCYRVEIDGQTGRILHREFTK